jgi:hypothetical protein
MDADPGVGLSPQEPSVWLEITWDITLATPLGQVCPEDTVSCRQLPQSQPILDGSGEQEEKPTGQPGLPEQSFSFPQNPANLKLEHTPAHVLQLA